jgi:hypothetical protein
VGRMIGVKS